MPVLPSMMFTPVFRLSPTDLENGKECLLYTVSSFCTFCIPSLSLFPKAWHLVKSSDLSAHWWRVGGGAGNVCFTSPAKQHYLQIKLNVCRALFTLNCLLAFLHVWAKENKTGEPLPGFCHDKHCIGAKAKTPHSPKKTGLTPMFWPLPFLSQHVLPCTASLRQHWD